MKLAYSDPPYPGQSKKHYADHPDYDGEVNHWTLLKRLSSEYDGWLLHTSSTALADVLGLVKLARLQDVRVMAWVKPFCAFKRNVPVAYAWEPVLVSPARKQEVAGRVIMRDFISEPIAMKRGVVGAKPEAVCRWGFEMMGAHPDDELDDLFPGSGAVTDAWERWRAVTYTPDQLQLDPS